MAAGKLGGYLCQYRRLQEWGCYQIHGVAVAEGVSQRSKGSFKFEGSPDNVTSVTTKIGPADIRKKFHQWQIITPEKFKDFKSFPSNPAPLLIIGRDGKQILAFRLCIPTTFLTTLRATKHLLQQHAEKSGR